MELSECLVHSTASNLCPHVVHAEVMLVFTAVLSYFPSSSAVFAESSVIPVVRNREPDPGGSRQHETGCPRGLGSFVAARPHKRTGRKTVYGPKDMCPYFLEL